MSSLVDCIDSILQELAGIFINVEVPAQEGSDALIQEPEDESLTIPPVFAYTPSGSFDALEEWCLMERGLIEQASAVRDCPGINLHSTPSQRGVRDLIKDMVIYSPDEFAVLDLISKLVHVPESLIRMVVRHGVNIVILPRGHSPYYVKLDNETILGLGEKTFQGRSYENHSLYSPKHRLIIFQRSSVSGSAYHEFAHALDHAYSQSHGLPCRLSQHLWNSFRYERNGYVTDYAGTNHYEYFAESFEACFDSGRLILEKRDPGMFRFLSTLLSD